MKFFVRILSSGKSIEVNLERTALVSQVEQKLIESEKLEKDSFYLTYETEILFSHQTLQNYRVREGCTVFFVFATKLKNEQHYIDLLLPRGVQLKIGLEETDGFKQLTQKIKERLGYEEGSYKLVEKYGQPKFNKEGANLKDMGLDFKKSLRIVFERKDFIFYKYLLEDGTVHDKKVLFGDKMFTVFVIISNTLNVRQDRVKLQLRGRDLTEEEYVEDVFQKQEDVISVIVSPPPKKIKFTIKDMNNVVLGEVSVKETKEFNDLKSKIMKQFLEDRDIDDLSEVILYLNDTQIEAEDDKILKDFNFGEEAELKVEIHGDISFYLIKLDGTKEEVFMQMASTIGEMKGLIEKLYGISADQYILFSGGQQIGEDDQPVIFEGQIGVELTFEMKEPAPVEEKQEQKEEGSD